MSFPFLSAHEVYPGFFQLGGRLSPVSIRDQMVRGEMLVDQALGAGWISGDRPLLVVGAGAAGATGAIHAAQHGVHTLLVDDHDRPFHLQAACRSRWVDPSQYDWPVDHWHIARYPWHTNPRPSPLGWTANTANLLAAGWKRQLNNAIRQLSCLWVFSRTTPFAPAPLNTPRAGGWTIDLVTDGQPWQGRFAMVVSAVGFGQETHKIQPPRNGPPTFSGFPFWETDPYAQSNYGLPAGVSPRIVISGAGDGGLQDFLRIMTVHKSARDIMVALNLPSWLLYRLQSAEDRAQRAYQWGHSRPYDHAVLHMLHHEHLDLAQHIVRGASIRAKLQAVLRPSLPAALHLVHSCNHFPNVYGLNRFLVLLIDAYLHRPNLIIPAKRTQAVTGIHGHTCIGSQHVPCHGQEHHVKLVDATDCWQRTSPGPSVTQRLDANIVIIRHGIDPGTLPQPILPDIAMPRQLLPYHVHR